jgi:hypothetical protein
MYKLAVDDVVEVPVKFTLKAGKLDKSFAFTLIAKRLESGELTAAFKAVEFNYKDFFESTGVISGWVGQRLVLDDSDAPVPFSLDALSFMLAAPGVAHVVYLAYMKECGAKEKN